MGMTQEYRKFRSRARLNLTGEGVPYRGGPPTSWMEEFGKFQNEHALFLLAYLPPPPLLGKIGRFWQNITYVETLG